MAQLQFTAVHEDGDHLVLSAPDGTEFLLPIDERLRRALRQRGAATDLPATQLRPRDVQSMIRAGQSTQEVAELTGWPAERVARFEAPILAERFHITTMARAAHVRGRAVDGVLPTLDSRVEERLTARGVDASNTAWDATRPEGGPWTVLISFVAGQRHRSAAWRFDHVARTVEALDDEARWLSEDEQALPGSATGGALLGSGESSESVDLMTAMRERSRTRGKRRKPTTSATDPAGLPGLAGSPDQVLPLEDLPYDPDTMGLPPAAHGAPEPPEGTATGHEGSTPVGHGAAAAADGVADGVAGSADTDPATTSYDVELAFDDDGDGDDDLSGAAPEDGTAGLDEELDTEDYEVDTSPQEATLADLFGSGDDDDDYDEDEDEGLDDDLDDEAAGPGEQSDAPDELEADLDEAALLGGEVAADGTLDDPDEELSESPRADGPGEALSVADQGTGDPEDAAPVDGPVDGEVDTAAAPAEPTDSAEDAPSQGDTTGGQREKDTRRRKDGRPGVPSWDDIMFGAKGRR